MIEPLVFLLPAFLVAVCLVGIHVYFGIQVLARQVIFVDLALAQIAALGATVAFMLGHSAQSLATYGYSLGFTLLAAVLLAFTRAWATRVPQEALIGVIYVVAAAAAILLIDRAPQGAEHLKQILTGNILTSGLNEVVVIVPLYAIVGLMHWLLRRQLTGTGVLFWEFVFYASFGVVVTSSVAIAGVLLVFSFLIVPAAIGVMYTSSPAGQLAIGWITGTLTSAAGLAVSFAFDLPTGAAMVCVFGGALTIAGSLYPFLRGNRHKALRIAIVTVRCCAAALLASSALQLAAAPRADQPLLDTIEYAVPSLRTLYFSRSEVATFGEASEYAERHRTAAERLNDLEKRNRTEGEALDDFSIGRISSFLKSYGEMRQGEQFVMSEVRARARERVRWGASLGLLALALLFAPIGWRTLRIRAPH
ncbi:MAG TPA: metal ABC transporter permease [Bradyrhizobium sp.]|jgi:zinc/manganese transport system permease protein|nr:metal ABC transporter permease [Bradyrhizobium sp.]